MWKHGPDGWNKDDRDGYLEACNIRPPVGSMSGRVTHYERGKPDRQTIIQSDEVTNLSIDLETLTPEQLHVKYGI